MASFQDLQYCKTDLIAAKGVVFCKYAKSSSALAAMEAVNDAGMVSPGYTCVCCILYSYVKTPKYTHAYAWCLQTYVPHSILFRALEVNKSNELVGAVHCWDQIVLLI